MQLHISEQCKLLSLFLTYREILVKLSLLAGVPLLNSLVCATNPELGTAKFGLK